MSDPTETGFDLEEMDAPAESAPDTTEKTAADLEAVFDVPVRVSVVLGRTRMPRKCWGKNTMLTPTNISQKCACASRSL